jgi:hypothetical protein
MVERNAGGGADERNTPEDNRLRESSTGRRRAGPVAGWVALPAAARPPSSRGTISASASRSSGSTRATTAPRPTASRAIGGLSALVLFQRGNNGAERRSVASSAGAAERPQRTAREVVRRAPASTRGRVVAGVAALALGAVARLGPSRCTRLAPWGELRSQRARRGIPRASGRARGNGGQPRPRPHAQRVAAQA